MSKLFVILSLLGIVPSVYANQQCIIEAAVAKQVQQQRIEGYSSELIAGELIYASGDNPALGLALLAIMKMIYTADPTMVLTTEQASRAMWVSCELALLRTKKWK